MRFSSNEVVFHCGLLPLDLHLGKNQNLSKPSVKEQTEAIDKKLKSKATGQKVAEFGLTNTTAQNIKRNHKDVGSPTSPELKKSPKKSKAGDKQTK